MINIKSVGQAYFRPIAAAKPARVEPAHHATVVTHKKHRLTAGEIREIRRLIEADARVEMIYRSCCE